MCIIKRNCYVDVLAFILENGKFSKEEMDKFLSMTIEFSRYMQEEILVVKLFFDEYLYYNTGEHLPQLLNLLQWMTSISVAGNYKVVLSKYCFAGNITALLILDLRENILIHVQNIFYASSLSMKCEIIKCLQKLITNLVRIYNIFAIGITFSLYLLCTHIYILSYTQINKYIRIIHTMDTHCDSQKIENCF